MAVTREGNVIKMTAAADAVTGNLYIQGIYATGAVAAVVDTEDNPVIAFASEGGMQFPCRVKSNGIKRGAGAGELYVYIV